jgi:hypothetical protein
MNFYIQFHQLSFISIPNYAILYQLNIFDLFRDKSYINLANSY